MDALYRFFEVIGYVVTFMTATTMLVIMCTSVSNASDTVTQKRMENKNVFTVTDESQRPRVSAYEVLSEIKGSNGIEISVKDIDLDEEIIKNVKENKTTAKDLGLSGNYEKSYIIDGEGNITKVVYK